jgi:anti-sigma regulatory factor (Ser/Thr protein kinase)
LVLPPGSTMVLYTDGLIERRDSDLDSGLAALSAALSTAPHSAERACDHIVSTLLGDAAYPDDVCLLVLRARLRDEGFRISVGTDPKSVGIVRHALRKWLADTGAADDEAFDILVASGEAVSNAVEHAYGLSDGTVVVEANLDDGGVALRIRDYGRWRAPRDGDRNRGFVMMRALMDEVDRVAGEEGTEVRMFRRLG